MRKLFIFGLLTSTVLSSNIYSDTNLFHRDDDRTYLGTSLRGGYTHSFSDMNAISLLGEAGPRNLRVGGTFGWKVQDNSFFKVSGELLRQNIEYAFFNTNPHEWMNQGAVGAGYEFDTLNCAFAPGFDITAYYAHAQSKNLNPVVGVITDTTGIASFVDFRRIAGANAAGFAPGIFVHPWQGAKAGVDLNYDHVDYDRKFENNESANGLGGTARFQQHLNDNLIFNAAAAFRKPFNNYEANIMWGNIPYYGNWALGVGADYTVGKRELPDTYNVALTADYTFDCMSRKTQPADHKGEMDPQHYDPRLIAWTATPAVHMPQVLAIADEKLTLTGIRGDNCNGIAPTLIGAIDPGPIVLGDGINPEIFVIPTAQIFLGQNLTFSLRTESGNLGASSISINSSTGVITINYVPSPFEPVITFFVTATNQCGSITAAPFVRILLAEGGAKK